MSNTVREMLDIIGEKNAEIVRLRDALDNMRLLLSTTRLSREYLAKSLKKTLDDIPDRVRIKREE